MMYSQTLVGGTNSILSNDLNNCVKVGVKMESAVYITAMVCLVAAADKTVSEDDASSFKSQVFKQCEMKDKTELLEQNPICHHIYFEEKGSCFFFLKKERMHIISRRDISRRMPIPSVSKEVAIEKLASGLLHIFL